MDKKYFLSYFDLDETDFERSELDYNELFDIYNDFKESKGDFEQVATLLSNTIQKYRHVHSVRWRVKDEKGLIRKIVRKAIAGKNDYKKISVENYTTVVTDLVGIRVLHLFKKEWINVCNFIDGKWKGEKEKIAYYNHADDEDLVESFKKAGYEASKHKAGYRSVHLVFGVNVFGDPTKVEIQVRTIFEEAWSEMDHVLRYPDHSNDGTLMDMITSINEIATNADRSAERARDYKARIDFENQCQGIDTLESEVSESASSDVSPDSTIETKDVAPARSQEHLKDRNNIISNAHREWLEAQERYQDDMEKIAMGVLYPDSPYESLAKSVAHQWAALGGGGVEDLSHYQELKLQDWIGNFEPTISPAMLAEAVRYANNSAALEYGKDELKILVEQYSAKPNLNVELSELLAESSVVANHKLDHQDLGLGESPLEILRRNEERLVNFSKDKGVDGKKDDEG